MLLSEEAKTAAQYLERSENSLSPLSGFAEI
jgi:hypothetical protein